VLVHGGAGTINDDETAQKLIEGVKTAAREGYSKLMKTGCVLDAVEASVRYLEDNENFNAGKGSVINDAGEVEMDASIMLGADLSAGAVTIVKDVKNPITLARRIMEKTEHVLLGAEGAKTFAIEQGLEMVPPGAMVTKRRLDDMERIKAEKKAARHELGTVGAVAIDSSGRLAAATSTGGREGKMVGRCSDTCVIGSGTYADDALGAVSTTGHGETIMKFCVAYEILKDIEKGKDAQAATSSTLNRMTEKLDNTAGAITISKDGEVGIAFTTRRMSWAYIKGGKLHFGIDHNQHECEDLC